MIDELMQKWAKAAQGNILIALLSLPLIVLLALPMALYLLIKKDKKFKELL